MTNINPEERKKITQAFKEGRVVFDAEVAAAVSRMDFNNPDRTIEQIQVSFWSSGERNGVKNHGGMEIAYVTKSAGNGRVAFRLDDDGKLRCYNQGMGRRFLRALLAKFLEQTELDHEQFVMLATETTPSYTAVLSVQAFDHEEAVKQVRKDIADGKARFEDLDWRVPDTGEPVDMGKELGENWWDTVHVMVADE